MRTRSKASRSSSGKSPIASIMRRLLGVRPESLLAGAGSNSSLAAPRPRACSSRRRGPYHSSLPAHVLSGEGKELADVLRRASRRALSSLLDDGTEHFVGLEIERRLRQRRVATIEKEAQS